MNSPIITVTNIGKKYNISHQKGRYITLRDIVMNIIKSPFSFLKSKIKRAAGFETKEDFWALRDVNFKVAKGETVGIIGANGAGKSTLLKILSQITPPTEGEIKIRGRVGSILEVGTGFHPELTGRENIFLNGAILGMQRKEIVKKFDEIVAFAGIEKFLDTPVKHYSSGMYVRLAFSVAAHMDPDILIIDEVLAVGDADFQKKCLGKMDEITKEEGRTILFVSHNMSAIRQLCKRTIVLQNGKVGFEGDTEKAIEYYAKESKENSIFDVSLEKRRRGDGKVKLTSFHMENSEGKVVNTVENGGNVVFVFSYECQNPTDIKNIDFGFTVEKNLTIISTVYSSYTKENIQNIQTKGNIKFTIKNMPLSPGTYNMRVRILADGQESDWPRGAIGSFEVIMNDKYTEKGYATNPESIVTLDGSWSHIK